MELNKDKKDISFLSYSTDDVQTVEKLLSEIPGIYDIESITQKVPQNTGITHIFKLKINQIKFKILVREDISELTATKLSSDVNEAFSGCRFAFGMWIIECAIGRYTPTDILNIIRHIHNDSERFHAKEQSELLDKYISVHIYEDYNDEGNAIDTARILTDRFMTDNCISDNPYRTCYLVLNKIFFDKLNLLEL